MNNKEILKQHLVTLLREKRIKLEEFIDNEMSEKDIANALKFISEQDDNHYISDLKRTATGQFSITLETGVTYL